MSRTDDLASLFTNRPSGTANPVIVSSRGSDVGFHQGELVEFDNDTGANVVRIAGATLTNVPLLGTMEAFALKPGDVVGILRYKTAHFILGRIAVTGGDLTIRGGGIRYTDGPVPPTPATPIVTPIFQGLKVAWDGIFPGVNTTAWSDDFTASLADDYTFALSGSKTDPPTINGTGGVVHDSADGGSFALLDLGMSEVDLTIGGEWDTQQWRNWSLAACVDLPATFGTTSDFESRLATGYQLDVRNWDDVTLFRNGVEVASAAQPPFTGAFHMRLQVQEGHIRGRWWAATDPEPGTWAIDYTDASPLDGGAAGFGASNSANRATTQNGPFVVVGDLSADRTIDWARVEIHVSDVDGFTPTPETLRSTIESPIGAEVTLAFPPDSPTQFVRLVSRSLAGKASEPSEQASGTPGTVDEFIGEIGSGTRIFYGPDEPVDPIEGELWYHETGVGTGLYVTERFTGGVWVEVELAGINQAIADALAAQLTADSKNQVFRQTTEPVATATGDVWFDTDDGNKCYRWDGAVWAPVQWGNGAIEPGSLVASNVIATGTISTALLEAQAVTADKMAVGTITAASGIIGSAAITDANIQNLTASKITAGTLSAALLLSGAIRTATSGARVSLDSTGLKVFNSSDAEIVSLLSTGDATFRGTVEAASATGASILIDPSVPELVAESDDANALTLTVVGSGTAGHIPQLLWHLDGWADGNIYADEDGGNQASLNLTSPGVGAGNTASIVLAGRDIAGPVPATIIELNAEYVRFQPFGTLQLGSSDSTQNNFVINGRDQGRGMVPNGWTTSTIVHPNAVAEAVAFSSGTISFRDGRAYMLTMKGLVRGDRTGGAATAEIRVRKGTTTAGMELLRSREIYCHTKDRSYPYYFSFVVANTTGATVATQICTTYQNVTGTTPGNVQLVATSTEPAYMLVEDVGIASDYTDARQIT